MTIPPSLRETLGHETFLGRLRDGTLFDAPHDVQDGDWLFITLEREELVYQYSSRNGWEIGYSQLYDFVEPRETGCVAFADLPGPDLLARVCADPSPGARAILGDWAIEHDQEALFLWMECEDHLAAGRPVDAELFVQAAMELPARLRSALAHGGLRCDRSACPGVWEALSAAGALDRRCGACRRTVVFCERPPRWGAEEPWFLAPAAQACARSGS